MKFDMEAKCITKNSEQTIELGRIVGNLTFKGAVLGLIGDLGGGKTHFSKGVALGLNINPDIVVSPTFTLLNIYENGRLPLFHWDLYRMDSLDELYEIGYEEYLEQGVSLFEWADRLPEALPKEHIQITITYIDLETRELCFRAWGTAYTNLLQAVFSQTATA